MATRIGRRTITARAGSRGTCPVLEHHAKTLAGTDMWKRISMRFTIIGEVGGTTISNATGPGGVPWRLTRGVKRDMRGEERREQSGQ